MKLFVIVFIATFLKFATETFAILVLSLILILLCIMTQNGHTHLKNLAANAARFSKCVNFLDYYTLKGSNLIHLLVYWYILLL